MNEHAIAFLVTISAGMIIATLTWLLKNRGSLFTVILCALAISMFPVVYIWLSWRPAVPSANLSFANFNSCAPVTDQGYHWGIFGDYPFGGSSFIKPSIQVDAPSECHLELQYSLNARPSVSPYCGIYAGFSARPAIPRDVSKYRGIQLEIWNLGEPRTSAVVYIELSPLATINSYDGYYQQCI